MDSWQQRAQSPTRQNAELAQFGSANSSLLTAGSPEPFREPGSGRPAGGMATPTGTGGITPPRARPKGKVLMLTPGASNARSGEVSPGPSILGQVNRQLDLLEAKLFAEMEQRLTNLQDAHERSDKIHDLALQRIEKKLADHDEKVARMDTRVAEVQGQVRGLNDSTLHSSRWADSVDGKMELFRQQVEEHFQRSASDLDAYSKDILSKIKSAAAVSEESQNKLKESIRRVDASVQQQAEVQDMLEQNVAYEKERLREVEAVSTRSVVDLQDRMTALENGSKAIASQSKKSEGSLDSRLLHLESQVHDHGQQVGRLHASANAESGWDARLHHHETVLTAMRSKLESFEEYTNRIDEAVRQKWGGQIDRLEKLAEEGIEHKRDMYEKHELLMHQTRAQHDELTERLHELEQRSQAVRFVDMEGEEVVQDELPSGQITPVHQQLLGTRSGEGVYSRTAGLAGGWRSPSGEGAAWRPLDNGHAEPPDEDDGGLSMRVGELVNSLKEMVPSVRSTQELVKSHGESLGDLARRLQALELSTLAGAGGRQDAGAAAEQQARLAELAASLAAAPAVAQVTEPLDMEAPRDRQQAIREVMGGNRAAISVVLQVTERLDMETRERQQAIREVMDGNMAAISELEQKVRAEFGPKIQGVERSVKKVIEGNTNIVQTLTAHAGSSLRGVEPALTTVLRNDELSPLVEGGGAFGAELDELQTRCDDSEAKILDAQLKLRQRVNNFQYLLEAANTKANSPSGGTC